MEYRTENSNKQLNTILLPHGHTEWVVLAFTLFYFGFVMAYYLQNRLGCDLPEMLGYDTSVHMVLVHKLINLDHIFSWDIRHPLMNIMFLPPIIVDYILSFGGYNYKWEVFTFYSCLLFSYSGLLLYKILSIYTNKNNAILLLCLFCSFAHSILLSIQIDSFILSLPFLLILVLFFSTNYYNVITNNLLFMAITGTTSTNVLKFFFYIYFACKKNVKTTLHHILISSFLFLLFLLFTIPDLFHRLFVQNLGIKYSLLAQTLDYRGTSQSKVRLIIENFISEPLLFHNQEKLLYIRETSYLQPYPSVIYYIPIVIIFSGVLISVIKNYRNRLIQLFLSFICVDIFIHIILGYGITEGQIFCAHWFFFIPILLALLAGSIYNKCVNYIYRIVFLFITIFFICHNFTCFIYGF